MKIVISPDSFKGSMTTTDAANQIEAGIRSVYPGAQIIKIPMADGGEGTVDTLIAITGGEKIVHEVSDPRGQTVKASYCWIEEDQTAVIETAAASGLTQVPPEERHPDKLSTFGTGELILHALNRGASKIILGLGGSATVDGGTGCLEALGVKFYDAQEMQLHGCGETLGQIHRMDSQGLDERLRSVEFIVASDVRNQLLGDEGAVYVFGPQKGLQPHELVGYEQNMKHFAGQVGQVTGRDQREYEGAGAAGGLGFGLSSFLPQLQMISGFELIARLSRLEEQLKDADMVITGEGKFDSQSLQGKVPMGISQLAKPHEVPVIVFTGKMDGNCTMAHKEGIQMVIPIVDQAMTLEQAMEDGEDLLFRSVQRFFETIQFAKERFTG